MMTSQVPQNTPAPTGQPAAEADPHVVLARWVAAHTADGWRVESWGPGQAVMVHGRRANHILHLLLSVFTLGLWLPIWLIVGLSSKESRTVLSVDQWGRPVSSMQQSRG